jgi:hypothetical protein
LWSVEKRAEVGVTSTQSCQRAINRCLRSAPIDMRTICVHSDRSPQHLHYVSRHHRQHKRPLKGASIVTRCSLSATSTAVQIEAEPPKESTTLWSRAKDVFCPFQDPSANARFLALALGGMLCSVATLIHDSYLPIFMRDELGMSNSVRDHLIAVFTSVDGTF